MQEENQTKRPRFLMVLLVLSSINICISLIGVAMSLSSGPLTQKEIDKGFEPIVKEISNLKTNANDPELTSVLDNMFSKTKANTEYKNFNFFYAFNWLTLIGFLLGATSIYFLYNLRKIGLHLYIIYSLFPILIAYAILPLGLILTYQVIYTVCISALFAILYGMHLKFMK